MSFAFNFSERMEFRWLGGVSQSNPDSATDANRAGEVRIEITESNILGDV